MPVYGSRDVDAAGGCRYDRAEIFETLDLDASGGVWPIVTELSTMAGALRERIEQGTVTGHAPVLIGS